MLVQEPKCSSGTRDGATARKFHTKLSEIGNLQTAIWIFSIPAAGVEGRKLTSIQQKKKTS